MSCITYCYQFVVEILTLQFLACNFWVTLMDALADIGGYFLSLFSY